MLTLRASALFAFFWLLTAASADEPPQGPYQKSCTVSQYVKDRGILRASCQVTWYGYRDHSSYNSRETLLELRTCPPDPVIFNDGGKLACESKKAYAAPPPGPYSQTCDVYFYDRDLGRLEASCQVIWKGYRDYSSGNNQRTDLDLLHCPPDPVIFNRGGKLECMSKRR